MREEHKKVIQKEMDRLTHKFRHHSKRTDQLQLTSCPSQTEKPKFV